MPRRVLGRGGIDINQQEDTARQGGGSSGSISIIHTPISTLRARSNPGGRDASMRSSSNLQCTATGGDVMTRDSSAATAVRVLVTHR
jgi:hypothetical protein